MEEKQSNMHIMLIAIVGVVAVVGIVGIMITMTSQNRVGQAVKVATPAVQEITTSPEVTLKTWWGTCCNSNVCTIPEKMPGPGSYGSCKDICNEAHLDGWEHCVEYDWYTND